MRLRHVETFVWLCRLRSFRATAERLNITQPAISSRLQALEKDLGALLIDRSARSVMPTPEGRLFLPYAEEMVRLAADARAALAPALGLRGRIRIGIIDTVTETWLPAMVEHLRRDHPGLLLDIVADTTLNLLAGVAEEAIAVAFAMPSGTDDRLRLEPVCSFSMEWFAAPSTVTAIGPGPFSKAELARLPVIAFPPGTPPNILLDGYFDRHRDWVSRRSSANSLMTMVRLVADGLGIAAMPPAALLHEMAEGSLVQLKATEPLQPIPILAISAAGHHPSPLTDAVTEAAREAASAFCAAEGRGLGWMVR